MKNLTSHFYLIAFFALSIQSVNAQDKQVKLFHLKDVELTSGPFKDAMLVDLKYIMDLDPDRLLFPFLREAGLETTAKTYENWENTGLDGHIGGHYLTALAQMYASANSQEAYDRLTYMLDELRKVQIANGNGYIGGVPGSKKVWDQIANGNIDAGSFSLNDRWVPLYNIHKTYAGLKDAYQIAGIELAKEMLIDYTDWMLYVTSALSDEQIQEMLRSEHGGLNEIFADVYEITGDKKYLELAYKFSHNKILIPLEKEEDSLTGMHANTQIPKVIGFETIAQLDTNKDYHGAAEYFWNNVVEKRTVAIGGNSVREHFNPVDDFSTMISMVLGPETCNTYNMLKLSEKLFQVDPNEKYVAYYERALYNHILSSQHPEKGGFVYFTPMRPGHYRVYSQPETSFWCCVGSGIENHGKYNKFIYGHTSDAVYVNLFIPSQLHWKEKGLVLAQKNSFPEKLSSSFQISLEKPQQLKLLLRYPSWANAEGVTATVNGANITVNEQPGSYIEMDRLWKDGDTIELKFTTAVKAEKLPDDSNYVALIYGPVVLGAKTSQKNLEGLFADNSRGGHIANGKRIPLTKTPVIITESEGDIVKNIAKADEGLEFSASEILYPTEYKNLEFIPFYKIHDSRYVTYLPTYTPESYLLEEKKRKEEALREQRLDEITIDVVASGEQQPESDHGFESEKSFAGSYSEKRWRSATGWFSYVLKDSKKEAVGIQLTYNSQDSDNYFKIYVNDNLLAEEVVSGNNEDSFFTKTYEFTKQILDNNTGSFKIRFEAMKESRTARIYEVRLLRK